MNELLVHEKSCLLRNIVCPYKGKGNDCPDHEIIFVQIMDHLKQKHAPVINVEEKLEYAGSIDDLVSKTYVLESYSRSFSPIFGRMKNNAGQMNDLFFIGVFLHGEKIEASQFKAHMKFINDDSTTFGGNLKSQVCG